MSAFPAPTLNVDFLSRLLMEKARLVAAIDALDIAISAYEALALGLPVPAIPPPGYLPPEIIAGIAAMPVQDEAEVPAVAAMPEEVARFAQAHDISWRGWDDLRRVNEKRDQLNLPRFKRPFAILANPEDEAIKSRRPAYAADFNEISAWANDQGVRFRAWADLHGVNMVRDVQNLPRFRRKAIA
jgi:hypothetical protein